MDVTADSVSPLGSRFSENGTTWNDSGGIPSYMSLVMSSVCGLILTVGLIGNCLVPVVIWNNRDLRNSTNLFLLNLSIADILVLCLCMPTALVEIHTNPDIWILGDFLCKAVPFVEQTVAHASVLTILAISFERYYVITRPLRAGYTCTRMRAFFVILAIWLFGCITTSPMLFIANYEADANNNTAQNPTCSTVAETFWPKLYFVSAICIFFFLPLVMLVVIYAVIARHLVAEPNTNCQQHSARGAAQENPNLKTRRQVVAMLGAVVVFFFVCLLPFRIFTLWIIISPTEEIEKLGFENYYNALNFCRVMFYLNSAINPILYNVMSSKFRSAFLKALGISWKKKRLLRHLSRQSTFNTTTSATTATTASSRAHRSGNGETKGAAELVKNMAAAREFIFTQHAHQYGRQSSRSSAGRGNADSAIRPLMSSLINPPQNQVDSSV